jgi:hypothetical protein
VWKEKPLQSHIQIAVVGDIVIDTGNPEVPAPVYRYASLEAFDVTGITLATGVAASGRVPLAVRTDEETSFPWPGERDQALEHARAEVLRRIGTCATLQNPVASVDGRVFAERSSRVATAADVNLDDAQLSGLCNGGALP